MNMYVIGGQTGDEGKGKIVDSLIQEKEFQHVARFNGGNNAGHTLCFTPQDIASLRESVTVATHLVPSGIAYPAVQLHLARGMVIDLEQLCHERIEINEKIGIDIFDRMHIDKNALLLLPPHRFLDLAEDIYKQTHHGLSSGSTGRGIGPAYTSETGRTPFYPLLFQEGGYDVFNEQIIELCERTSARMKYEFGINGRAFENLVNQITKKEFLAKKYLVDREVLRHEDISYSRFCRPDGDLWRLFPQKIAEAYWAAGMLWKERFTDVMERLEAAQARKEPILFEGAQGSNLDKRWGQQPNVTSSHTLAPEIPLSTGIHLEDIPHRMLVFKAYATKVGTHHFVTEMQEGESVVTSPDGKKEDLATKLKKVEFGVVTGRQRMVGWFDLVEARKYVRLNAANEIAITKLDMLTGAEKIKICTGYIHAQTGKYYTELPNDNTLLGRLRPGYSELLGWKEDISHCTSFYELPPLAQEYISVIINDLQAYARKPIRLSIVSTGPGRKEQFFVTK